MPHNLLVGLIVNGSVPPPSYSGLPEHRGSLLLFRVAGTDYCNFCNKISRHMLTQKYGGSFFLLLFFKPDTISRIFMWISDFVFFHEEEVPHF